MLLGKVGITLAGELREHFPGLKVIVVSGYAEHGLSDPATLERARFMAKPFSRHEVVKQFTSMLEATAS